MTQNGSFPLGLDAPASSQHWNQITRFCVTYTWTDSNANYSSAGPSNTQLKWMIQLNYSYQSINQ